MATEVNATTVSATPNIASLQPSPVLSSPAPPRLQASVVTSLAMAAPAAPPPKPPVAMRSVTDPIALRRAVFDQVKKAASSLPPVANKNHTLKLVEVDYDREEPTYTKRQQKEALLSGNSLSWRLKGTWQLVDNATQQIIDEKRTTLANVPYLTSRGTFVNKGSEYGLQNQQRLLPGAYGRRRENDEVEVHVNPLAGQGFAQKYHLDPVKNKFYLTAQNNKLPLLPLLKSVGATDDEIKEAWGEVIYAANREDDNVNMLDKIFRKIDRRDVKTVAPEDKRAAIRTAFEKIQLDPDIVRHTLGKPYTNLNKDALLSLSKKLLGMSRGEADPDDRDHLANQTVFGPEDLFAERIRRDYDGVQKNLLMKASFRKSLQPVQPRALEKQLQSALLKSGLGMPLEEVNPLEILDKLTRISRMGVGGIGSTQAIPSEARSVQPSQLNFVDGGRTPENMAAGVDVYLAAAVKKGDDGRLYAPFIDPKTQETVYKSSQDIRDSVVAFPGAWKFDSPRIPVIRDGRLTYAKREEVDFLVPDMQEAASPLTQLVPMMSASKPHRIAMGSRMLTQAVSLVKGEAPLVQTGIKGQPGKTYQQKYGEYMGAIRAPQGGTVVSVDTDGLRVQYDDGTEETHDLYNMFPFNRKSFMHQTPLMQPGQRFDSGQVLAKSNYTDDDGNTALGLNVKTAYMNYRGLNYEDAVAISESLADKLTSEHAYITRQDYSDKSLKGKKDYIAAFPGRLTRKQLDNFDDDGVVKIGTVLNYDDPMVLAGERQINSQTRVAQRNKSVFADRTQRWDLQEPGIVTDVVKTDKGVSVVATAKRKIQLGSKLAGLYGDKGVVSAIIPDDEMPHDKDGQPFELLLSEQGLSSRTNESQMHEALLAKIAKKTGKPYAIVDFDEIEDLQRYAEEEAAKHNVPTQEEVYDPVTGKKLKDKFTGYRYYVKLHHESEDKAQQRSTGRYTSAETPAKGGEDGSKRVGTLLINGLMAHASTGPLEDIAAVRGQKNDDYHLAVMKGYTPATPRIPHTYQKHIESLRAAGINVVPDGPQTHIYAMTRKQAINLTEGREIKNAELVRPDKDMAPIPGGLFDKNLTGGNNGNRYSYIRLPEPLPNPVMEEPIRKVLGLTEKKYREILAGREDLNGYRGPRAIEEALSSMDLDKEIQKARVAIAGTKKGARDEAIKKLKYLQSAKSNDVHPKEWLLDRVPVIPPVFRPISVMSDTGQLLIPDVNLLYQELIDARDNFSELKKVAGDAPDERLALYDAWKAVVGLADPIHPKLKQKNVRGLLAQISGDSPKHSMFQQQVLSRTVDMVGRGVIIPDPDLDMDSVGIPEPQLWETFKTFVTRRLSRRGMSLQQAYEAIENKSPVAKAALMEELKVRPVTIDRAPHLHKYSSLAMFAKPITGHAIRIPPVVTKGLGADFDGNCLDYDTELVLTVCQSRVKLALSATVSQPETDETRFWTELSMRLSKNTRLQLVTGGENETVAICLRIGDLPQIGTPQKTKHKTQRVFELPPGLQIASYDFETGQAKLCDVTRLTVDKNHACCEVRTARGRMVRVSDNESLCVFDPATGELAKKKPQESIGLFSPYIKRDFITGNAFDFDLGWWYGAMTSDGWVRENMIGYSKSSVECRNRVVQLARERISDAFNEHEYFGDKAKGDKKFGKSAKVHLNGRHLVKKVLPIYDAALEQDENKHKRGALFKRLPQQLLLNGNRDCLLGLLSGCLDGDCTLGWNNAKKSPQFVCKFNTSSPYLRDSLQLLLRKLGIRCSVTTVPAKARSQESYVLCPSLSDCLTVFPECRLVDPQRQALLDEFIAVYSQKEIKDDIDLVPISREMAGSLAQAIGCGNMTPYSACRKAVGTGYLGRATARRVLELVGDRFSDDENLQRFERLVANDDVHWEQIVTSEPISARTVYDLEIPETKVFAIASGLVVYDTMQFHVLSTDKAVTDALERQLPSKMLMTPANFNKPAFNLSQNYLAGLFLATNKRDDDEKPRTHTFRNKNEALKAIRRGEISIRDIVEFPEGD